MTCRLPSPEWISQVGETGHKENNKINSQKVDSSQEVFVFQDPKLGEVECFQDYGNDEGENGDLRTEDVKKVVQRICSHVVHVRCSKTSSMEILDKNLQKLTSNGDADMEEPSVGFPVVGRKHVFYLFPTKESSHGILRQGRQTVKDNLNVKNTRLYSVTEHLQKDWVNSAPLQKFHFFANTQFYINLTFEPLMQG